MGSIICDISKTRNIKDKISKIIKLKSIPITKGPIGERLAFLDLLRFIAAFIVVVAHMYDSNVPHQGFQTFDLKKDFSIFHTGVAGVIIFFLISGYIMPQAIIRCPNIKNFLIKRSIRIYPLLIAVMIYGLFRYGGFKERMLVGLILPLADFINGVYVVKGVDWTLRIEFFYYILIGLIYFKGRFDFKNTIFCIIATSILIIVTYLFSEKYFNYRLIYLNFIFLGSLLCVIEKEKFKNKKHNIHTFLAIISSILTFELLRVDDMFLFPGLLFGVGIFLFLYFIHQTRFQIKSNNVIIFLGNLSYASYLLHLMIYEDLYNLSNSHIFTPILFAMICYGAYFFIEKPSMVKLKKLWIKK